MQAGQQGSNYPTHKRIIDYLTNHQLNGKKFCAFDRVLSKCCACSIRKVPPCSHCVSNNSSKVCGKLAAELDKLASGPFEGESLRFDESTALA